MALTKAGAEIDAWAEVAQNAIRNGAEYDASGLYCATLHVDCCLSSTAAHTGTLIIVEIRSAASGNGYWHELRRWIGPTGTAIKVDLAGAQNAGNTVLGVTNPVTNNLDVDGKRLFLENTDNVVNSEIVFQVANSGDDGDTITIAPGLANNQSGNSDFYTIDAALTASPNEAVGQYHVALPDECLAVRVRYVNKYDNDGATVHTRTRISGTSAV